MTTNQAQLPPTLNIFVNGSVCDDIVVGYDISLMAPCSSTSPVTVLYNLLDCSSTQYTYSLYDVSLGALIVFATYQLSSTGQIINFQQVTSPVGLSSYEATFDEKTNTILVTPTVDATTIKTYVNIKNDSDSKIIMNRTDTSNVTINECNAAGLRLFDGIYTIRPANSTAPADDYVQFSIDKGVITVTKDKGRTIRLISSGTTFIVKSTN